MIIWIFLMLLIVASVKFSAAQIDWCSKEYDCIVAGLRHKHTMCEDESGVQDLFNVTDVATDVSRKDLLRLHNAFRNKTAGGQSGWPKGANIRYITAYHAVHPHLNLVKFGAAQIDWCSNKFDCIVDGKTHKHTMCDDGGGGPQDFVNITDVSTDASRKNLLRVQNTFRNNTAGGEAEWPKGANIRQLTWDYTLQSLAVHWALKCRPENDVCRTTPDYDVIGQLVGAVSYKEGDTDPSLEILSDWIKRQNEISSGSINDTINSFVNGEWDPATNIMWAETVKMGCGEVLCMKGPHPSSSQGNFRVLVCNYAPGGNIPSKSIYEIGDPCSAGCPAGTACKTETLYTQLCALPGDPTDDSLPTPPPDPGPSPAPGPKPSTRPTAPTLPTIPSIPTIPTIPTLPPAPFINFATVKISWKLHLLLCSALLSKLT